MIGRQSQGTRLSGHRRGFLFTSVLLAAGLAAFVTGCTSMPKPVRNLPAKIGLRSQEAELRAKVEADKFPTAKEAGI